MTVTPPQPPTKTCSACKHDKPLHQFNEYTKGYRRVRFTDPATLAHGFQDYCRECQNRVNREHYQANKGAYFAKAHDNRTAGLQTRLALVQRLLPERCATCPSPITIHKVRRLPKPGCTLHRDASPKWMAGQGWAEERIWDEMEMCTFVCPTCFRRATGDRPRIATAQA